MNCFGSQVLEPNSTLLRIKEAGIIRSVKTLLCVEGEQRDHTLTNEEWTFSVIILPRKSCARKLEGFYVDFTES